MRAALFRLGLALSVCSALSVTASADITWTARALEHDCREVAAGNADQGQDFIFRKCAGIAGASTFLLYQEGTRLSLGFGSKAHVAVEGLDAARQNWPVDWAGETKGGTFTPRVAIARFTFAGEEPKNQHLLVFRLRTDGMSCLVADVRKNSEARRLALEALNTWTCLSEPRPVP